MKSKEIRARRVPEKLHEDITRIAGNQNLSINKVVIKALRDYRDSQDPRYLKELPKD